MYRAGGGGGIAPIPNLMVACKIYLFSFHFVQITFWTVAFIFSNPDVLAKLKKEVNEVIGDQGMILFKLSFISLKLCQNNL